MKVLMINGSRREKGCTYTALKEVAKVLEEETIDSEVIHVGEEVLAGHIDEIVDAAGAKMREADALIIGSPVYYASPTGELIAFLDRFFWKYEKELIGKPASAITSARRGGTTATLDVINKYIVYAQMPLVASRYWNMVHGNKPEEIFKDHEGLQIMHVLGENMAWLLKSIEAGKAIGLKQPGPVEKVRTNYISEVNPVKASDIR